MIKWKGLLYMGEDFSDKFLISESGEILNRKTGNVLKSTINKGGYLQVCVSLGSRSNKKLIRLHDAIASTFVEGYKDGLVVNHKDGNKRNNEIKNLEWTTIRENNIHAIKHNLIPKGIDRSFAKVTREIVKKIRDEYKTGNYFQRELAEKYGVSISTISAIVRMKRFKDIV